ncbi:MAG: phosphate signaling complex protein PhoU [Lentisphaerae bacterium]|nr:phosphate signaling complex protein PhoU [Lentisphaerota bacterium]
MSVHLDREIARLKKVILEMCARTEQAVQDAAAALADRNDGLARRVIEADDRIDRFEISVEEDCLKVLALHQPVASDLRFLVAVMRLNRDLERIGDLAVKIAERALALNRQLPVEEAVDFAPLARMTQSMLHRSIDALINLDGALAREVIESDDEVDAGNRAIVARVKDMIRTDPTELDSLLHLISIARHYERIADHAVNIAEDVIYLLDGRIIRHPSLGAPAAT